MASPFKTKMVAALDLARQAIDSAATDPTALIAVCNLHRFLQAELTEREIIDDGSQAGVFADQDPDPSTARHAFAPRFADAEQEQEQTADAPAANVVYNHDRAIDTVDGDETITRFDQGDPLKYSTLMSVKDTLDITRGEDPNGFPPQFVDMKLGFWFGRTIFSWAMEDDRLRVVHG